MALFRAPGRGSLLHRVLWKPVLPWAPEDPADRGLRTVGILGNAPTAGQTRLFLGAGSRGAWRRSARRAGGAFRAPIDGPAMLALSAAVRDGASLLEEHAVRSAVRSLLLLLSRGKIHPSQRVRFMPGITVEVISSNNDGSAAVACLSWGNVRAIEEPARAYATVDDIPTEELACWLDTSGQRVRLCDPCSMRFIGRWGSNGAHPEAGEMCSSCGWRSAGPRADALVEASDALVQALLAGATDEDVLEAVQEARSGAAREQAKPLDGM